MIVALLLRLMFLLEADDLFGGSRTIISLIAVQTSSRYLIGSTLRSQVCNFR